MLTSPEDPTLEKNGVKSTVLFKTRMTQTQNKLMIYVFVDCYKIMVQVSKNWVVSIKSYLIYNLLCKQQSKSSLYIQQASVGFYIFDSILSHTCL